MKSDFGYLNCNCDKNTYIPYFEYAESDFEINFKLSAPNAPKAALKW